MNCKKKKNNQAINQGILSKLKMKRTGLKKWISNIEGTIGSSIILKKKAKKLKKFRLTVILPRTISMSFD